MTKPAKIVILISGRGSNMAAIIDACAENKIPATVHKVISDQPQALGLAIAQAAKIETIAIARNDFSSIQTYEAAILTQIDAVNPDLICLAGFMRILSPEFVRRYKGKILNIHPSLLPKYPGLNTHARTLAAGDKQHGCSVHFVTEIMDEGPIVMQSKIDIYPHDNENTLSRRLLAIEHQLYVDAINQVLRKNA